jgi:hypothetical protein
MVLLHGFVPKVEVGPNSSKQQLLDAVGRHFMSQVKGPSGQKMVTSGSSVFRRNLVQTLCHRILTEVPVEQSALFDHRYSCCSQTAPFAFTEPSSRWSLWCNYK